MSAIITRAGAKARGLRRYFTGEPCKRGHVAEKWTAGGRCVECAREWREVNVEKERERLRIYREANVEKVREVMHQYYAANREKCDALNRKWVQNNREKIREASRKRYEANPEEERERQRQSRKANREKCRARERKYKAANRVRIRRQNREYYALSPGLMAARVAQRRAQKLQATPAWMTGGQRRTMRQHYVHARFLGLLHGQPFHVDHIEPLQGEDRCGLHVPWNLQILTKSANSRKGNRAA